MALLCEAGLKGTFVPAAADVEAFVGLFFSAETVD
jgi:hypothetical protein